MRFFGSVLLFYSSKGAYIESAKHKTRVKHRFRLFLFRLLTGRNFLDVQINYKNYCICQAILYKPKLFFIFFIRPSEIPGKVIGK